MLRAGSEGGSRRYVSRGRLAAGGCCEQAPKEARAVTCRGGGLPAYTCIDVCRVFSKYSW